MRSGLGLLLLAGCEFSAPLQAEPEIDAAPGGDTAPRLDAPIDSPAPLVCPINYQAIDGLTSRYRLTGAGNYRTRHEECKADSPGQTHLVVLDTVMESNQLRDEFDEDWWVGAVQMPGQTALDANWFQITGGPLPPGLWAIGQPNDTDGIESGQQNASFRLGNGLGDEGGNSAMRPGLCECDGTPVDATIETYAPQDQS